MKTDQIVLTILFIASSASMTVGSNILLRLVQKAYPEKLQFKLSPSKKLLTKLKTEKATDEATMRKVNMGLTLERMGWIGYGLILLMFVFKWFQN
jgi:hypothetical protein